jgi:phage gpG-like protein
MQIEIKNIKSVQKGMIDYQNRIISSSQEALLDILLKVETKAKNLISTVQSKGNAYPRQKGKKTHYASKPGFPPNTDTGKLVQSITHEIDLMNLEGAVGTGLKYGKYLEFGTKGILPRPWLSRALDKRNLGKKFIAELKKGIS